VSQVLSDNSLYPPLSNRRLALAFYCLGSLDLLDLLESKTNEFDRQDWREWIWEQHTRRSSFSVQACLVKPDRPILL